MKKTFLPVLLTVLFILCVTGMADAALTTIGTAQFGGSGDQYNLIWDNDNNGNSVIWLDYSNTDADWSAQKAWANELNLTYSIDSAYTVTWVDDAWRLPSAGLDPQWGYNQTTSEMGDLFYNDLGLTASDDASTTAAQLNATNFDHLIASRYWSGTEYELNGGLAWYFRMDDGLQARLNKTAFTGYGLAVRSGRVSAVPVPGAIWLLSSGLAGLVAFGRWRRRNGGPDQLGCAGNSQRTRLFQ